MKRTGILAVCPESWLGVRKAISQDADAYSGIDGARAAIRAHRPGEVRFGGYDPAWRRLVKFARKHDCRVVVTIHHTPSFHEFGRRARTALAEAIKDHEAGLIDRFEAPHEGMARTLSMLGVPCTHRRNSTAAPRVAAPHLPRPGLHVGIFGTGMPWKNTETLVLAAALAIKNHAGGVIHVQHIADPAFVKALGVQYELHPTTDADAFFALVASMTVNLAVSFTESFGYQIVESFLLGVPCLFSPMAGAFFDVDARSPLWRCRVDRIDDPAFIAARISEVLAHREEVATAGLDFCKRHVSHRQSGSDAGSSGTPLPSETPTGSSSESRRGILERFGRFRAARRLAPLLEPMFDTMRRAREASEVIAVTQALAGPNGLAVNRAMHALFPGGVLELPSEFASAAFPGRAIEELTRPMIGLGFSQLVVGGFPAWAEPLARRAHDGGIRVGCLYHGSLAECGDDDDTSERLRALLRLCRDGVIARLACSRKGLARTIERIAGIRAYEFSVPAPLAAKPATRKKTSGEGLHIGVLGCDMLRGNIANQVAAALLIEGTTVHVAGEPRLDYWNCNHRLVRHEDVLPRREYLDLLRAMDLNLDLAFSGSCGQLAADSLAVGVPCMLAHPSDIYDQDLVLRDRLVSPHFDDPDALSRDIATVLRDRDALVERGRRYAGVLSQRADALLKQFLAP